MKLKENKLSPEEVEDLNADFWKTDKLIKSYDHQLTTIKASIDD
jgi:hypothetical protein